MNTFRYEIVTNDKRRTGTIAARDITDACAKLASYPKVTHIKVTELKTHNITRN